MVFVFFYWVGYYDGILGSLEEGCGDVKKIIGKNEELFSIMYLECLESLNKDRWVWGKFKDLED